VKSDFAHLTWLVTAVVALVAGVALLVSPDRRARLARNRFFRAVFGEEHPERTRWLAGFYLFAAAWGFTLFFAVST
jgi:hypothetical protein